MRLKRKEEMSDHIAQLESKFVRLDKMWSIIDENMKVSILILSQAGQRQSASTVAATNTVSDDMTVWNRVSMILFEEKRKTFKTEGELSSIAKWNYTAIIAKWVLRWDQNKPEQTEKKIFNPRCYTCNQFELLRRNLLERKLQYHDPNMKSSYALKKLEWERKLSVTKSNEGRDVP